MNRSSWRMAGGEARLPEVLWEDGERRFCRTWSSGADGARQARIAVLLSAEHPTPAGIGRLAHEYALKEYIDGEWALRPLELVRQGGQTVLLLEYHDGVPLDQLIAPQIETGQFLRLAVALGDALARLHERGLVHKDIKPANVLVDTASDRVWLTGFGVATRLPREQQLPEPPELIAGTLAYMAPEQTGRMNRSIDSRSDLYSLGVTLYQALSGDLPFTASDPMEWVHCHIARRPAPPMARGADVPSQVSAIVMKLLAKTPEERYQTAAGVTTDLRRCLADWESRRAIEEFALAERDTPDRLLIAEHLYGRESEIDALLAVFEQVVVSGTPALVLVRGAPGIGKSSVVSELHKVLVPPRGLFASGKFEQLRRDVPYATLAQAFQSLIRRLLGRPEAELSRWRDDLRHALGPNGALAVELIPELKFIIGEQPPVPDVPLPDAKARFQMVVRRLIGVFARPAHPLALFLDDLQWLDAATLDVLEDLLVQPDVRHLLVVGAYRDTEVDAAHPLTRTLSAIRRTGAGVQEISLGPLEDAHLARLIADALHCDAQRAMPLARLIHEKTAGNPFFANQFLRALADEGLLTLDAGHARWGWDVGAIRAKGYTDNVVELMVGKLRRLPLVTQMALRTLACLGTTARASILAIVDETSEEEVHSVLWEALRSELIARSEDSYRFAHDRIREAAYSLIPEDARAQSHLRVGRLLAAHLRDDEREEAIFAIVGQLDRGATLIVSRDEREQLAELDLIAAKRAQSAAAHASALGYLIAGAALMAEDRWERRHDLSFELELHRAECEFLTGELTAAAERLDRLGSHAADAVERARVACLSIDVYTTLGQIDRAVGVCLTYLKGVGVEWPPHPTEEDARREYERIWSRIASRPIGDLGDLPLMTDPASLATMDVLARAVPPAHFTDANLLSLAICRMIGVSLEHGNTDASCFAYVWFGLIAGPRFGNYRGAYQVGRVGYELVEARGLTRFRAATYFCFGHGVMPWAEDFRACCDMSRRTFAAASRSGDLTYAAYSCNALVTDLLAAGEELSAVQREAEHGLTFARTARFGLVVDVITAQLALVRTLRGLTPSFDSFDDGQFDERRFESYLASTPALALPACWYWIRKLQARFLAGDHASAVDAAVHAEGLLWTSPSLLETAEYHFYGALARAALCEPGSSDRSEAHLDALATHHIQLAIWAHHCPDNFETRAALVAAEIARIEGRPLEAETHYELAIRSARATGLVHNEALANELAARFYAARGFDRIASVYMRDARSGYLQWGADGKVRQLEERHAYLTDDAPRADPARTVQTPVEHLDLGIVLQVLQAVSGEIDLERLITTVMRLGLEHAGAERGLLILPSGDAFRIEASAEVSSDVVQVALRQSAITAEALPESVLHFVLRTRETVLLHDASAEHPFSDDEYVRRHRARSVLCMPLSKQGRLVGLIYLENNLASGVFTPARIAVLELLGAEAATSLERARLYRDLHEREARVRRLVDSNIIGIVIWHADGRILDTNDAFLRLVGYGREDLLSGRVRWTDLTTPEWHARDASVLTGIQDAGAVRAHERECVRKDGTRVPVLAAGAVFEGALDEGVAFVLDLTERKQAELAQRESEREARLIVDSIPGMIVVFSAAGVVESANRPARDFYGIPLEAHTRWETADHVHPEDLPRAAAGFAAAVASGDPFDMELRARRADGVYRWLRSRGAPLRDSHGRVVRWYNLITDIDERKRAEAALAASERKLQLTIDTIPAQAWSARPDGIVDFFSQHYLDFIGLSAEQASGWGWTTAVHPDDVHGLATTWRRIMASGASGEAEVRLRRHDGAYRWFLFRASPFRDEQGGIVRWYGVNTDIEDRKRAEAELRRAYDSFADAQRLSRTGSFITDLVGDDHNWSDETYRIFEFDPATRVTVERIREILHPDDLPPFDSMLARALSGANVNFAFRIVTPRGAVKHVRGVAHVIERIQGRPMFVGALQDVTETMVAEEALSRARSELAHVARVSTLSALTASIAHEVSQPLTGVITNASTCLRMLDADPPNVDGARETTRRALRDGHRASGVITGLRALFSKKDFALGPLDLNDATREVIALSFSEMQRNRVILQTELADDLPPVTGDRVQLQQVILNLLRNASDAMAGVDDRPRQLLVRTEPEDGDRVRVTVRDAGVGVDRQSMGKLFDAFYTTKADGMGIGLAISRSIVDRHQGRLWAEPNDGPGATFALSIPCRSRSSEDGPRRESVTNV